MPLKMEVAEQLTGEWAVGLFEAPVKVPLSFCYGCICPCCMAAQQRLKILNIIGESYVCCGGMFPCGPLGQEMDENCAWVEACCCTGCAISGNRFLIQTRLDRQNTPCDDCLLWVTCLAPYVICCLECIDIDVPEGIENAVDCLQMIVAGCMLAQQQKEIDIVEKEGFSGPSAAIVGMLPPHQQQMVAQAKPSMGHSAGMAMGAFVGGAAGAGAMMGGMGPGGKPHVAAGQPVGFQPMAMPVQGYSIQQGMPAQQSYGMAPVPRSMGGFMGTAAPSGASWMQYCQGHVPSTDLTMGMLAGPWGECLAWAKVFEARTPGWEQDPNMAGGPCGQVIETMVANCPGYLQGQMREAAERLEMGCEQALFNQAPLPVIGHVA